MCVLTPVFFQGELFGFCGSIAHKSDIGGPVPGSCSGQAREIFNEGLHLPAVRYQRRHQPNLDIERLIAANSRTPELVLGDIRGQLGSCRLAEQRVNELLDQIRPRQGRGLLRAAVRAGRGRGARRGRRMGRRPLRGRALHRRRRRRPRTSRCASTSSPRSTATGCTSTSRGSADQTKGPANIRPPLVRASIAYCLISMIDPHMYVSSGLLNGYSFEAREG